MMAQQTPKPPQDSYAQRGKELTSAVQRLRGWVGSDPSRNVELADALVTLNAHRLLGHEYATTGPDAQDALRRSAELLTAKGPLGPYSSVDDAIRYLTAVVQLAVTQVGLGLAESAGRTLASVDEVQEQLGGLPLQERLDPLTAIWALSCRARSALASSDVSAANAYADAAQARLVESGLRADSNSGYLAIDIDRLASDTRWAAGQGEDSLGFLYQAKERYDQVVDGRLREPAGLSPARLNRLAEPLFGMYRDMADRLMASGEIDIGLGTRRELVELLRGLVKHLGQSAQVQLAAALTDLADDLVKSDRVEEADVFAAEAAAMKLDSPTSPGLSRPSWTPKPMLASYATSAPGRTERDAVAAWLEAERPKARRREQERLERAKVEAARREAEQAEAEKAAVERAAEEQARTERAARAEAERREAAEAAERLERKRRREQRLEEHRLEVERREAERREAERLEADRRAAQAEAEPT